jgi:[acyl-carrier-protein] S-malonyltransferase
MQRGVIYPGQGAQFAGMGRDWAEAFDVAKATFAEADEVLGFPLTEKLWPAEGAADADDVNRTDIAQPGIYTVGVAITRVLRERGLDTKAAPMTAGLSLGEYTALWCAGGIEFADGLRLVRLRGEAMQDAAEQIPSGMLSLMGADEDQAIKLAEVGSAAGICAVANLNAPGQIILSGEHAALEAAAAAAKDHGVRRTRPLVVAGGFHSECMRPAADRLAAALAEVEIREPEIPFVSNVTGGPTADPETIRSQLAQQVCAPVRWEQSMRWALAQGIRTFLEPGPGEVLAGIMRKIDEEADVASAATPQKLES